MAVNRAMADSRAGAGPTDKLAGLLLFLLMLLAVVRPLVPTVAAWLPGLLGWGAFVLLWHRLGRPHRYQTALLIAGGALAALVARAKGVVLEPVTFLRANVDLVALLTGVGFLRLVSVPQGDARQAREQGAVALLRTVLGTHLLSSVINLSALFIVADRLLPLNRDRRAVLLPLARAFSSAAFWSPFFAAMGVALTYAPSAQWHVLVLHGLPLAAVALLWTVWESRHQDPEALSRFVGYPLQWEALRLPLVMVAGVLMLHWGLPGMSIILLVAALSVTLSVAVLMGRDLRQGVHAFIGHVLTGIPRQAGELTLFLAAGLFAVGMGGLFQAYAATLALDRFGLDTAAILMATMVVLAVLGVHPVISIAMAGTWLKPLSVDGNLLGTLFLCVWAIGVVAAPFSGMNLALAGRYGVRAREVIGWHLRYVLFMFVVAVGLLFLYHADS